MVSYLLRSLANGVMRSPLTDAEACELQPERFTVRCGRCPTGLTGWW